MKKRRGFWFLCDFYTLFIIGICVFTPGLFAAPSVVSFASGDDSAVMCTRDTGSSSELVFTINSFKLSEVDIESETWFIPDVEGASHSQEKGMPGLPVLARSIIIPNEGNVYVRVTDSEYKDYPGYPIAPSKGPIPRTVDPASMPYTFGDAYQESVWPSKIASAGDPYILRNLRGVTVRVCPFQYFPETETLRVYTSVTVEIFTKGVAGLNSLAPSSVARSDHDFTDVYANHFLNYLPTRYTPLNDQGSMLVIAADSLVSSIQPLVNWKRQKGIATSLVPLSHIGSTSTAIKNYVQSYYNTNGLTFLLLVGDAEDVPSPTASGGLSDPTYSKLAGSDDYPDIFVGRFSASTTTDIDTMVQRVVTYEKTPDTSGSWYQKATGLASDEGSNPSDAEHMNDIRTSLLAGWYSSVDQIYDPGATASQVATAVNQGRGLINYVGHGDITEWVTSGFNNNNVNNLTNTTRWPFIFDVACVNGEFGGKTCFAEAWTRASHNGQPAGALAIYASTINQDWVPPMDAQDEFNALLLSGSLKTYGGLCFNASMKMMDMHNTTDSGVNMFNTWTVFGDPSMTVRTALPTSMSVTPPGSVNSQICTVNVSGVQGALVAFSSDNELLGSAYTDSSGNAVVTLSSISHNTYVLTVTAFNKVPYITTISGSQVSMTVSPSSIERTLEQTVSYDPNMLAIANDNSSTIPMTYSISVLPDYMGQDRGVRSLSVSRSIAESTLTVIPGTYTAGSNMTFTLIVTNGSSDNEWLTSLSITFPASVNVTGAQNIYGDNDGTLSYNGVTGNGVTVAWEAQDDYNDAIMNRGEGSISVSIDPGASGNMNLNWVLNGDGDYFEPHTVTGQFVIASSGPPPALLTLTTPNGGSEYAIGSTESIAWSSSNYTESVTLSISCDGGNSWSEIVSGIADSGSYSWSVDGTQSSNCLIKVSSPDGSVYDVSDSAFAMYDPVDWISLSQSSGTVSIGDTNIVTISLSATGRTAKTYYALLRVTSEAGITDVPVEMQVLLDTNAVWTLWGSSGANGVINPSGPVSVNTGQSQSFVANAGTDYIIASLTHNGSEISGAAGMGVYTTVWNNVTGSGAVHVTFAEIESNAGSNDTPIVWLRSFYDNEPDLDALKQTSDEDTDGDNMVGWEEYIAGCDPTDSNSCLEVEWEFSSGDPRIIRWPSVAGRVYAVEYALSPDDTYTPFADAQSLAATPPENAYTNSSVTGQSSLMYRVQVHME